MLVVRVELWSAVTGERSEIARLDICNVGGTAQFGEYEVKSFRGRNEAALERAQKKRSAIRLGTVSEYPALEATRLESRGTVARRD